MTILFYLKRDPFGWLSNFSPHAIEMNGRIWPTVEHYYQAQKFAGTPFEEQIRQAPNPLTSKTLANDGSHPIRLDWDAVKLDIMRRAVLRKFETHPDLREALLQTGEQVLIEDAPDDPFWGRGADGTGANHLGKILMQLRSLLRDGLPTCATPTPICDLIDQIVGELLARYVGGVEYFDHLDATWRSARGWPVVQDLLARALVRPAPTHPQPFARTFPCATPLSTGRFGMFLHNAFGIGLVLVTGGLRTNAPMDDLWYMRPKFEREMSRDFILFDDSFYSGRTRDQIRDELERQGGRLVHSYIIYDGSRQPDPDVTALYRYYDHFAPDAARANPNVRVNR